MTPYGSSVGDLIASQLRQPPALNIDVAHKLIGTLELPGVDSSHVIERVREALPSLFDVSLAEVLVSAWSDLVETPPVSRALGWAR
jgi:hypothetical protein